MALQPTTLPKDSSGYPIQTLALSGDRVTASVTGSSNTVALPASALKKNRSVVRLSATTDCFINFGGSGVVAAIDNTSTLFPKGVETLTVPVGADHIAVIQIAASGTLQVETVL